MKVRNIFFATLLLIVGLIIYYSFQGKDTGKEYQTEIDTERKAKDDFMRSSDESPFVEGKKNFKNLNYFRIDLSYRISAKLSSIENKKVVVLPTSDNLEKKYLEY